MNVSPEQRERIERAAYFINENPSEDLSLERLASIANYSPFHFQKLFVAIEGETPKQYVQRVRLETAAHAIVMFHHRSITEIAFDLGFSSSASFSRAFKQHFGITPQELKNIPHEERFKMWRQGRFGRHLLDTDEFFAATAGEAATGEITSRIRVEKLPALRGAFVRTSLSDVEGIERAFESVARIAGSHDLLDEQTQFVGGLYPHQKLYQAMVVVPPDRELPNSLGETSISEGKFAVIPTSGPLRKTFAVVREFTGEWLPASGYRIADIFIFELFATSPALGSYEDIDRTVHVRIEPAR